MSGTSEWSPVHHEDMEEEPAPKPKPKAKPKAGPARGEPPLMLTIPPNMIAGLWSLSEALKENTEVQRELLEELRENRYNPKNKENNDAS